MHPRRLGRSLALCLPLALVVLVGVSACSWNPIPSLRSASRPSTIVILVENLGFGSFSCGEETGRQQGFQTFCDEAVRFTHAYTPSLMSQSTLASILTSKFPYEHGVRTNGAQSLSAKEETLAEKALTRGYRTAFFTGGAPIWRRSGISQGFEVFDDNVSVNLRSLYRTAPEVVSLFLNWLEGEPPRPQLMTFLYFADLQFIDAPTTNELGEVRESSYRSQIDEIDEGLSVLVKDLKRRKMWDNATIILMGLQGNPVEPRGDELTPSNLFSESTRATLMIKPARPVPVTGPFSWKVDANVSLVDVGTTLLDLMGSLKGGPIDKPNLSTDGFEIGARSLKSVLAGQKPDWPLDRVVISESAWPQWRGFGGIRSAIRQGPYLYVFDERAQLFDTLADSQEATRVASSDATGASLRLELAAFLRTIGYLPWAAPSRSVTERLSLGHELWREREPSADTMERLKMLAKKYSDDPVLKGWRALLSLRSSNWADLKAVATLASQPTWAYVAARNLGEKVKVPEDPCFDFLKGPMGSRPLPKTCREESLGELLTWANEAQPEAMRTRAMESFLRFYSSRALATRVAEHNQVAGLRWDAGAVSAGPEPLDLILALPELRKIRVQARARLAADRK